VLLLNEVLRSMSGLREVKLTGSWKEVRNEEVRNLQSSLDIISLIKSRRILWTYAEDRNPSNVSAGDAEGNNLLGEPRRTLKDDITSRCYGSWV
jgi:hypothetical protein